MSNWSEDAVWVRNELKRLADAVEKTAQAVYDLDIRNLEQHSLLREDIVTLKIKSGLWGACAGALLAAAVLLAGWAGKQCEKRLGQQRIETRDKQAAAGNEKK